MKIDVNNVMTMSSREVAELCEKRHDNVMVDVEKLLNYYKELYTPEKAGVLISLSDYVASNGKSNKQYLLSKDAVLDLITGYSLPHRHAVNQRWQELEQKQQCQFQLPDFTNPAEAAIAWADQWKRRELAEQSVLRLEQKIDEDTPKVLLADALLESNGGIRIGDFAKASHDTYGLGRNKMYKKLREWKLLDNRNIPYQTCLNSEWMYTVERPFSAEDYSGINIQVWVTPKGQKYIINRLQKENVV